MIWHLVKAGIKAFAASVCLGCLLLFGLGGPGSGNLDWVISISLLVFGESWLLFAVLGPRPPTDRDSGGEAMEG